MAATDATEDAGMPLHLPR